MKDILTSTNYSDVTGKVAINPVDALLAVAAALHRIADAQEHRNAYTAEEFKRAVDQAAREIGERHGHA